MKLQTSPTRHLKKTPENSKRLKCSVATAYSKYFVVLNQCSSKGQRSKYLVSQCNNTQNHSSILRSRKSMAIVASMKKMNDHPEPSVECPKKVEQ